MIQPILSFNNIIQWCSDNIALLSIIVTVISILVTIVSIIASKKKKRQQSSKGVQNAQIPEGLLKQYLNENEIYIQPYITRKGNASKQLLHDFFLKEVFIKESVEPNDVYIIFGDTGSGKTSALVHLFDDYCTQYKQNVPPYPNIRLFSLRDTPIETINDLPDKGSSILLLDALDETASTKDPTEFQQFIECLKALFHDFPRIVITCRPQLFSNQKAADIVTQPQIRTSTGWQQCTELFLEPFNDQQVQDYLDRVFTFRIGNPDRNKAEEIVNKHAYIAIRPLVLKYIKDIVESKRDINTALDLYDIIIENNLRRDLEKIVPNPDEEQLLRWWSITSDVAGYMYRHGKLSVSEQELDSIPSVSQEPQFKQRSMLTRTGDEYHFSHKSYYEYFMAYRFLLRPEEIPEGTLYTMDFALQLYDDLFNAYKERHSIRFAELNNLPVEGIAVSLHEIGSSLDDINHFSEAEPKYQAALELFRELEGKNPGHFINDVAMTLNNLANLHYKTNNHPAAEEKCTEALKICRELAKKDPDTFLPYVAGTLNNLANLHSDINNYTAAEEKYTEALKIRRELAKKDPDAFLPDVAMTLNNLAVLYDNTNNYTAAEEKYTESLKIRRELAKKNPDAFLPKVAITLNNLAILHRRTNNYTAAEEEYTEALKIRRDLAKKNPDAVLPDVAMTLFNMAILYLNKEEQDIRAAEAAAQESLDIYKKMAEKSPAAFDPYVKKAEELLNNIQQYKQLLEAKLSE